MAASHDSEDICTIGSLAEFFANLSSSASFAADHWERQPVVFHGAANDLLSPLAFGASDIIASANRGELKHSYKTFFVAPPRQGDTFRINTGLAPFLSDVSEDQIRSFLDNSGTMAIGQAAMLYPAIQKITTDATNAFGLVCTANVYLTKPEQEVSVHPHNDVQDVLIIQLQGLKAWSAWAPNARQALPTAKGYGKGKSQAISLRGKEPAIETMLQPGDVMYIPRGFIHNTSTPRPHHPKVVSSGAKRPPETRVFLRALSELRVWFFTPCKCVAGNRRYF